MGAIKLPVTHVDGGDGAGHASIFLFDKTGACIATFASNMAAVEAETMMNAWAERPTLLARVEELEGALAFYRDGWSFKTNPKRAGLAWHPKEALLDDCGNRARAALSRKTGGEKP